MAEFMKFAREVRQEGSKVTWPSRNETTVTTVMVFVFVTLATTFLFAVDQLITFFISFIL